MNSNGNEDLVNIENENNTDITNEETKQRQLVEDPSEGGAGISKNKENSDTKLQEAETEIKLTEREIEDAKTAVSDDEEVAIATEIQEAQEEEKEKTWDLPKAELNIPDNLINYELSSEDKKDFFIETTMRGNTPDITELSGFELKTLSQYTDNEVLRDELKKHFPDFNDNEIDGKITELYEQVAQNYTESLKDDSELSTFAELHGIGLFNNQRLFARPKLTLREVTPTLTGEVYAFGDFTNRVIDYRDAILNSGDRKLKAADGELVSIEGYTEEEVLMAANKLGQSENGELPTASDFEEALEWTKTEEGQKIKKHNLEQNIAAGVDNTLSVSSLGISSLIYSFEEEKDAESYAGLVYGQSGEKGYRGEGYLELIKKGEGKQNRELVSTWDYAGWTRPKLGEDGILYTVGKSVNNAAISMITGYYGIKASALAAIGNESGADLALQDQLKFGSYEMSTSGYTRDHAFSSVSGLVGFGTDIAVQILAGMATGGVSAFAGKGLVTALNWGVKNSTRLRRALFATKATTNFGRTIRAAKVSEEFAKKAVVFSGKFGSTIGPTLMASGDTYDTALAAGFSKKEAASIHIGVFGSLLLANRLFAWSDDLVKSTRISNEIKRKLKEELPKAASKLGLGAQAASKSNTTTKGFKKFISNYTQSLVGTVKKLSTDKNHLQQGIKGYLSAMASESMEEVTEGVLEESVKQLANAYSRLTYGEEDYKKRKYRDIYDKNFWSEFGGELALSAAGGAFGGAFGKVIMGHTDPDVLDNNIDLHLGGNAAHFYNKIDQLYRQSPDLFGSTKLSTQFNEKGRQLTVLEASKKNEPAKSVAQASYELMKEEFAFAGAVIDGFGGKAAFEKVLENNPDLKSQVNNISLAKDLKKMSIEAAKLVIDNDLSNLTIKALPENIDAKTLEEFLDEYKAIPNVNLNAIKRVAEIKREIEDIKNGKASDKYFFEALVVGLLDPNDENYKKDKETLKKYGGGKALLHLLNNSTSHHRANSKREAVRNIKRLKANTEIVNKLNSTNAIEVIKELMTSNPEGILLDRESSSKIKAALADIKLDESSKEKLRAELKEAMNDEELLKLPSDEDLAKHKLIVDGIITLEQLKEFMLLRSKEYNERIVDNILTDGKIGDILLASFEPASNVPHHVEEYLESDMASDVIPNVPNIKSLFKLLNPERDSDGKITREAKTVQEISEMVGDAINEGKGDYTSTMTGSPVRSYKNVTNKISELSEEYNLITKIISLKTFEEGDLAFDEAAAEFLVADFDLNSQGELEQTGSLMPVIDNLVDQSYDESFIDVERVKSLLFKVKARKSQLATLQRGMEALANLRYKRTLIADPKYKGTLIGKGDDLTLLGFSELFEGFNINPEVVKRLQEQDKLGATWYEGLINLFKSKDNKILSNVKSLFSEADAAKIEKIAKSNQSLLAAYNYLEKSQKELEESLARAQKNSSDESKAKFLRGNKAMSIKLSLEASILAINEIPTEDQTDEMKSMLLAFNSGDFNLNSISDTDLIENFKISQKLSSILFNLDDDSKTKILNNLNGKLSKDEITLVALSLYFDQGEFYTEYKKIVGDSNIHLSSADQEAAAMLIVAHATTDLTSKLNFDSTNIVKDTMFVSGEQGSGKTQVLSIGVKIAQKILNNRGASSKILFAANHANQIKNLGDSLTEFEVKTTNNGADLKSLTKMLNEPGSLDDTTIIIFDEATFIPFDGTADSKLGAIMSKIDKINEKRFKENKPLLKLVLTGDETQNGHMNSTGLQENVGSRRSSFLTTKRLDFVFRGQIADNLLFISNIKPTNLANAVVGTNYLQKELSGFKSKYGKIKGNSFPGRTGGIRFVDSENSPEAIKEKFNDPVLIADIKKQIEDSKTRGDKAPFRVGVVLGDPSLLEGTALGNLIKEYGETNFRVANHTNVQGDEFDYVISLFTKNDIGESRDAAPSSDRRVIETASATKMATTLGRARYYSHVINTTSRIFESEETSDLSIPDTKIDNKIIEELRNVTLKMIGEPEVSNSQSYVYKRSEGDNGEINKLKKEAEEAYNQERASKIPTYIALVEKNFPIISKELVEHLDMLNKELFILDYLKSSGSELTLTEEQELNRIKNEIEIYKLLIKDESHSIEEFDKMGLGTDTIYINNRELKSFKSEDGTIFLVSEGFLFSKEPNERWKQNSTNENDEIISEYTDGSIFLDTFGENFLSDAPLVPKGANIINGFLSPEETIEAFIKSNPDALERLKLREIERAEKKQKEAQAAAERRQKLADIRESYKDLENIKQFQWLAEKFNKYKLLNQSTWRVRFLGGASKNNAENNAIAELMAYKEFLENEYKALHGNVNNLKGIRPEKAPDTEPELVEMDELDNTYEDENGETRDDISDSEIFSDIESAINHEPKLKAANSKTRSNAVLFNKRLEKNGIILGYGLEKGKMNFGVHTTILNTINKTNTLSKQDYNKAFNIATQNLRTKNLDSKYELVGYKWGSNNTGAIITTEVIINGQKHTIIVAVLPTSTFSSKSNGGKFIEELISKIPDNESKISIPFSGSKAARILHSFGSGSLSRGQSTQVSKMVSNLKKKHPNATFSPVMINTVAGENNGRRGEGFIFYSTNPEIDLNDPAVIDAMISGRHLKVYPNGDPIRDSQLKDNKHVPFMNGIGVISLNNEPASLLDMFEKFEGNKELNSDFDIIETSKAITPTQNDSKNIVLLFKELAEIIGLKNSPLVTLLDDGHGKAFTEAGRQKAKAIFDKMSAKEKAGLHSFLSNLSVNINAAAGADGNPKVSKTGYFYPNKNAAFSFMSSQGNGTKDTYNFKLLEFFNVLENVKTLKGSDPGNILSNLDLLMASSKKYKRGFYRKLPIIKGNKNNGIFAITAETESTLDSAFSGNVTKIGDPTIRLRLSGLYNILNNKEEEVSNKGEIIDLQRVKDTDNLFKLAGEMVENANAEFKAKLSKVKIKTKRGQLAMKRIILKLKNNINNLDQNAGLADVESLNQAKLIVEKAVENMERDLETASNEQGSMEILPEATNELEAKLAAEFTKLSAEIKSQLDYILDSDSLLSAKKRLNILLNSPTAFSLKHGKSESKLFNEIESLIKKLDAKILLPNPSKDDYIEKALHVPYSLIPLEGIDPDSLDYLTIKHANDLFLGESGFETMNKLKSKLGLDKNPTSVFNTLLSDFKTKRDPSQDDVMILMESLQSVKDNMTDESWNSKLEEIQKAITDRNILIEVKSGNFSRVNDLPSMEKALYLESLAGNLSDSNIKFLKDTIDSALEILKLQIVGNESGIDEYNSKIKSEVAKLKQLVEHYMVFIQNNEVLKQSLFEQLNGNLELIRINAENNVQKIKSSSSLLPKLTGVKELKSLLGEGLNFSLEEEVILSHIDKDAGVRKSFIAQINNEKDPGMKVLVFLKEELKFSDKKDVDQLLNKIITAKKTC